ncbi:formylglycine-generating enzyme family protein [bacterium]|nr:formylglycine-generating enzyme family protein [bacterium]
MKILTKLTLAFSLFALLSCGGSEGVVYEAYGKGIGPKGGKYTGVDNVTIIVPPKAVEKEIAFTIFSIDTPSFTSVSKPVTHIYIVAPAAYEFKVPVTVIIPYDEGAIPDLLDEVDIQPYYTMDRQTYQLIPAESYELDIENNIVKISTYFLGSFHLGFSKELVEKVTAVEGETAEMIAIPAGEFSYGAPKDTPTGVKPGEGLEKGEGQNKVELSAFYIDKYEVTNRQYRSCVTEGVCIEPRSLSSIRYADYFYSVGYDNFPVIWVSWNQATTYCQWAGKRLPTEAEWEKAARGATFKTYPWGEKAPEDNSANTVTNFSALFEDVVQVTEFQKGVSSYGVYNMAGNVSEWVSNWYDIDSYYTILPAEELTDPQGPPEGIDTKKVSKGGSWVSLASEVTTFSRVAAVPHYSYYNLGFRCAKDISE